MPERRNVLLDPEHRYAYVYVPKVASTALLAALYREQVDRNPELDTAPLDPALRAMHSVATSTLSDLVVLGDRAPYTFAFVRNPYARLLSAYRSKLDAEFAQPGTRRRFTKYFGLEADDSFGALVGRLGEWPESKRMNWHFAPQSEVLQTDRVAYDEILKMEDLPTAFEELTLRLLGKRLFPTTPPRPTRASHQTLEAYDPELLAIVNDVFAADFENFGYEVASAE